jgi:hypothetical protein
MSAHSGPWAEIQDLERFRTWLIALARERPSPLDPQLTARWQDERKPPGERLSQLFF